MPACNWNLPPGLSIQLTQGEGVDSPGRGSAKATSASFAGLPVSPWPPAAITTYCLPCHS